MSIYKMASNNSIRSFTNVIDYTYLNLVKILIKEIIDNILLERFI